MFHQGYMRNDKNYQLGVACLRDHGPCWISPRYVFELNKFDFEVKEFNVDALPKVNIDQPVKENGLGYHEIEDILTDYERPMIGKLWFANLISKEGTVYCVIDNATDASDDSED